MIAWKTAETEMTHGAVIVKPSEHLHHAFSLMKHGDFRHLPVVDHGQLVGILSDRDLLRAGLVRNGELVIGMRRVEDAMTRGVWTCKAGDRIGDIADQMLTHKVDALPVVDGKGEVIGIITSTDLLMHLRRTDGVLDVAAVMEARVARD